VKKLRKLLEKLNSLKKRSRTSALLENQIINLLDTQREKRIKTQRKWVKNNREKVNKTAREWMNKNKEKVNKYQRKRYHKGKPKTLELAKSASKKLYHENKEYREKKLAQQKEYYYKNKEYFKKYSQKEETKEWHKKYRQKPEVRVRIKQWTLENKERIKNTSKKWNQKNKEKLRLKYINRQRIKKGIPPAKTVEQHFQERQQLWFKKIYWRHLYDSTTRKRFKSS